MRRYTGLDDRAGEPQAKRRKYDDDLGLECVFTELKPIKLNDGAVRIINEAVEDFTSKLTGFASIVSEIISKVYKVKEVMPITYQAIYQNMKLSDILQTPYSVITLDRQLTKCGSSVSILKSKIYPVSKESGEKLDEIIKVFNAFSKILLLAYVFNKTGLFEEQLSGGLDKKYNDLCIEAFNNVRLNPTCVAGSMTALLYKRGKQLSQRAATSLFPCADRVVTAEQKRLGDRGDPMWCALKSSV